MMTWFSIWFNDKQDILYAMRKNMVSDIEAGYDPKGNCILKQKADIEEYEAKFNEQMDKFKTMDDKAVNRWCYYDLKKRGAIA